MITLEQLTVCTTIPERRTQTATWRGHVPFAFLLMNLLRPRRLVELGTLRGDSYCAFCQSVLQFELSCECFAVDHWRGDAGTGRYASQDVLPELKAHHDPRYGAFSKLLQMSFDEARPLFEGDSIDLLHIDGCHEKAAAAHDVELWLPTLSERGVLLMHDTQVAGSGFGVGEVWADVRARYPAIELRHSFGLGVAAVGPEAATRLEPLLSASPRALAALETFCVLLAHRNAAISFDLDPAPLHPGTIEFLLDGLEPRPRRGEGP